MEENNKEMNESLKEENKKAKKKPRKRIVSRILNTIVGIILLVWMGICLVDFFNVREEKEPMFCISKETIEYEDGTVDSCLGLGYKVYNYKRDSYRGIEFGPFWINDRSNKE